MIRRDYILRLIESLGQELARIDSLKDDKRWDEADTALDEQVKKIIGMDAASAVKLSETDLLALLIQGESSQFVREKTWVLTSLLRQAGDVAVAQDRLEEGNAYYLKALRLLLKVLHQNDIFDFPEFVPRVEALADAVAKPVPLETQALLMEHYETTGQFDRAARALQVILADDPAGRDALEFGVEFFQRLQAQSDERLAMGNLPRPEVDAALSDLQKRRKGGPPSA